MPNENSLGNALLGGLPIIGGIASSLLQRRWAIRDREAQNEYNSPANQLKLLKEAGLPAVSYFAGGASAQSEQPRTTDVDLGTKELGKYGLNQLEKKQLEILDADARSKNADADLKQAEAKWLLSPYRNMFTGEITDQTRQEGILAAGMQGKGLGVLQQKQAYDIAKKYQDEMTALDVQKGKLDNAIKEITRGDMELFNRYKRDILRRLTTGEKMSTLEIAKAMLGMYMSQK